MVTNGRIEDKQIIAVMLKYSEVTAGDVAKMLDAEDKLTGVIYHLNMLSNRGIVKVKKKKKGSIYSLSDEYMSISTSVILGLVVTVIFTIFGVASIVFGYGYVTSIFFFFVASVVGTIAAFTNFLTKRREKIKTLFDLVA